MKRWLIMIGAVIALVAVVGGIWGYNVSKKLSEYEESVANKKETVTTLRATTQEWREELSAIGTLHATRGADLAAEVAGVVDALHFESGADVKQGQLLAELRAGDDLGKLESLRANAQLARLTVERARAQFEAQAISKAEFESAEASVKSAEAQLAEQQAIVDKKRIRAPFAGHIGIRNVDPGQYVTAGTKIVTLQTLDPIYVDFSLPQQDLARVRVGQRVTANSDTYTDLDFTGTITAIDPKVDVDTRNVQVRATVQNPKRKLLPGMFVNVAVDVGKPNHYITLPQTAITYSPYGSTAYVVVKDDGKNAAHGDAGKADAHANEKAGNDKNVADKSAADKKAGTDNKTDRLIAKQVFVTTGPTRGDQVAVLKGIAAGDEVVTSGQLKLKNNTAVLINNSVQPSNDPAPTPKER